MWAIIQNFDQQVNKLCALSQTTFELYKLFTYTVLLEGTSRRSEEEEEEEKEVDPSLVGSLDNVYTDETEAAMNQEDDPFKKVAMSTVSSPAEMEKTANALVLYSSEHDDSNECLSPLPGEESYSIAYSDQEREDSSLQQEGLDLLNASSSGTVTQPGGSQELLPDIIGTSSVHGTLPDVQVNHSSLPPDIAPSGTLPPDLAAAISQQPLDLLNPEGSNSNASQNRSPLDLTEGILDV